MPRERDSPEVTPRGDDLSLFRRDERRLAAFPDAVHHDARFPEEPESEQRVHDAFVSLDRPVVRAFETREQAREGVGGLVGSSARAKGRDDVRVSDEALDRFSYHDGDHRARLRAPEAVGGLRERRHRSFVVARACLLGRDHRQHHRGLGVVARLHRQRSRGLDRADARVRIDERAERARREGGLVDAWGGARRSPLRAEEIARRPEQQTRVVVPSGLVQRDGCA